ncbi:leucine-rich repeat domain-containing protein [Roseibium sp.]|uniref:leucine-rich repeat domain-containing protein n=1 Tax=Roseibium sp. TaxID=1936156 RepID=UPI003BAB4BAD
MRIKFLLIFVFSAFFPFLSVSQTIQKEDICVDFFGSGVFVDGRCKTIFNRVDKISAAELPQALRNGTPRLEILSDDAPEEPFDLAPLSNLETVHSLYIYREGEIDLSPLQSMKGLYGLELSADAASSMGQLTSDLEDLVELRLWAPRETIDLTPLSKFPNLRVLLVSSKSIVGQDSLRKLKQLEHVNLQISGETDFSVLSALPELKWLEISGKLGRPVLSDIEFVSALPRLKKLVLRTNNIKDLSPLSGLRDLTSLNLSENAKLSDISAVANLTKLVSLKLRKTSVSNIMPIHKLSDLQILWLDRTQVSDITPLENLSRLWGLGLSGTQVSDITPLRNLPLKHLNLRNTNVVDLSPLPLGLTLKR